MADVARSDRVRWFLKHKSEDDWVLACRIIEVAGVNCRGRKTWGECVR